MPMLAADTASTAAKPSMILPRNRRVGSFGDTDCELTPNPRPDSKTQHRERELPDPTPKIRTEWIMARKFGLFLIQANAFGTPKPHAPRVRPAVSVAAN